MSRDPLREWREQYARNGTRLGFRPETDAPFRSSVHPIADSPRIVRTALSPGLMFRDRAMIRDGDDNLSLVVSMSPGLHVWHRGREVCLGRNEATVVQVDHPGTAGTRRGFSLLEISITQREWQARDTRPGDVLMRTVRRNSECLNLLTAYVRSLTKTGMPAAPEAREAVRRHVIDLTVLCATRPSVGESGASCVVAARTAAILDHIAACFHDPDLSGPGLARTMGMSPRYLQRLLERTGKSFTAHVNEARLQRAFALLAAGCDRPIADIAFKVGFSDLAHFYRLFRARFGDTPKGVRIGAAEARDH